MINYLFEFVGIDFASQNSLAEQQYSLLNRTKRSTGVNLSLPHHYHSLLICATLIHSRHFHQQYVYLYMCVYLCVCVCMCVGGWLGVCLCTSMLYSVSNFGCSAKSTE